jgi:hypothetical protein
MEGRVSDNGETAEIKQLRLVRDQAREKLNAAQKTYDDARIKAFKWPVGTILRSSKGELAKVLSLFVDHDYIRVIAVLKNKNGLFGLKKALMWRSEWQNAEVVNDQCTDLLGRDLGGAGVDGGDPGADGGGAVA